MITFNYLLSIRMDVNETATSQAIGKRDIDNVKTQSSPFRTYFSDLSLLKIIPEQKFLYFHFVIYF